MQNQNGGLLFSQAAGEGPPLLILHGLFGSSDNWRTVAKPLQAHFTVHFVDLRNHGRSFHSPVHDYSVMADDVVALLESLSTGPAVVLGHSMGGKVAQAVAFQRRDLVARLIVADMGVKGYTPHHTQILAALAALPAEKIESRQQAEAELVALTGDVVTSQFLLKSLYRPEAGGFAWRFNFEAIQDNYDKIIAAAAGPGDAYEGPTLFIRGGASSYVPDADLPYIQRHFPDFTLETLPGAGHWLHAEQPQAFIAAVLRWLGHPAP